MSSSPRPYVGARASSNKSFPAGKVAAALTALLILLGLFSQIGQADLAPGAGQWTGSDIGNDDLGGSASYDSESGELTIQRDGGGTGGGADWIFFYHGDLQIGEAVSARFTAPPTGSGSGEKAAGVMIRSGLEADAAMAALSMDEGGNVSLLWRPAAAETAREFSLGTVGTTDWLRLVAEENAVIAYASMDRVDWTPLMGVDLPLATAALGGVFASPGLAGSASAH